jgi:MFS family permease
MGGDASEESISETFYIAVAFFGLSCCLGGPLLGRYGPRLIASVGVTLFMLGQSIAALACFIQNVPLLYIGYGFFGGMGIGTAYICPISVLQKWFPERRGFAAGLAVGAFGSGSVIASFIQNALLVALDPVYTFLIMGTGFFLFSFPGAQLLRFPPSNPKPKVQEMAQASMSADSIGVKTLGSTSDANTTTLTDSKLSISPVKTENELVDALSSPQYWMIYFTFFFAVMPGLVMVSRLADVTKSVFKQSASTATWVVGVNGIFNVLGRVVFGTGSDRFGRVPCYFLSVALQILCLIGLIISIHQSKFELFLASIWMLTAGYGGVLGLTPGLISDIFGVNHIGALYGVAMTAFAAGGVIGGVTFNKVIGHQREMGTPNQRIYDSCIYSMIPIVSIAGILLIMQRWYTNRAKSTSTTENSCPP